MLRKLVKLVHIYVHEELRSEVAEWKTFATNGRMKTLNDIL